MSDRLRCAAQLLGQAERQPDDASLLERLARDRDPAAFTELLKRHGPAVWAVCRRVTRTETDAEDAFQATFLVLVRDAMRVRKASSVGSWLYGVAARLGGRLRATTSRVPDPDRLPTPTAPPDPVAGLSWSEVRAALDEELGRLSDSLRAPVLLCYFDGLTQEEAAAVLGWRPRTVKARVARARKLLRERLTRRGIELPVALAVPLLSAGVLAAVPPRLCTGLSVAAADLICGRPPNDAVSPTALALARTEVATMSLARIAILLAAAVGLLAAGSLLGRPTDAVMPPQAVRADPPSAAEPELKPPASAVRIGTTRFRPAAGWHKKVFFTADGKTLVAPLESKVVELWNPETGLRTHEIPVPSSLIYDSDYFARGNILALFGFRLPDNPAEKTETTVWLVDTATRKVLRALPVPDYDHSVRHTVRFSPDGKRLFISVDTSIRVWDVKSGEELIRQKHKEWPDVFTVSPDGKTIAFGHFEIYTWNWDSGEEPRKLVSLGGFGSEHASFGPDNKTLFVAAQGGRVMVFDVASGRQTGTLHFGSSILRWAFSPDGRTLATTYYATTPDNAMSHAVVLWDSATGKELGRFSIGQATAENVSWSPDGTRLASATDYRLWVWDVKTRKPLGPSEPGHEGFITGFAFGPDGQLYTASDDHTVRSWNPTTGKPDLELIHDYWVRDVAVSPDGSLVAGSSLRNDLRIWDTKTGTERFKLLGNGRMGGQRKVRFTPDGKHLIAWGDDLYLRVWDVRNGKLLAEHRTLPGGMTESQLEDDRRQEHLMALSAADISADCSTFVFSSHRGVQVFDVKTGKQRLKFEGDPNGVMALALSPDGKRLAVAGREKSIQTRLPDGRTRNTPAPDHRIAVWDLATEKIVWETTVLGWSSRIAFSPDGKLLAEFETRDQTRDVKCAVRVWEAGDGKDLGRIELPSVGHHLAFDRTGKKLAVAYRDTTATLYDLETALKPPTPKK